MADEDWNKQESLSRISAIVAKSSPRSNCSRQVQTCVPTCDRRGFIRQSFVSIQSMFALPPFLIWDLCGATVLCVRDGCGMNARERALEICSCVTFFVCANIVFWHAAPCFALSLLDLVVVCEWGYRQGGSALCASM